MTEAPPTSVAAVPTIADGRSNHLQEPTARFYAPGGLQIEENIPVGSAVTGNIFAFLGAYSDNLL